MNEIILDNCLPQKQFEDIKNFMLSDVFSWNFTQVVSDTGEKMPNCASYYFTHLFYYQFHIDEKVNIFAPLLEKLACRSILRIKGNLYPSTEKIIHHDNHVDYLFPHRGAIFYINTNDGFTILEDKIKVKSVENRLLIFDSSKPHRSTTCTDEKCRININFNFF